MLQINTGKLYRGGIGRTNQLTGVLYANVRLPYGRDLVTLAGKLRSAGSSPEDLALVYEIEERLEPADPTPGVLASHTVAPFLDDFIVIASFGLGGVFSRQPDTVRSLTAGRPGFSSYEAPGKYVASFFDRSIYISDEQADAFIAFVDELLALERRSYLGAMRAMRTFIAGLHRIPDDLALAYTLIVSALESLAQDFDGFAPTWSDLEDRKRLPIDAALNPLTQSQADVVRAAILKNEHVALARRYRAFVQARVDADYFRRPDAGARPLARIELDEALRQAYTLRSAYIHRLRSLPTPIALPHWHWETTTVERKPVLTFQGLFHLTRHIIRVFVLERPKCETEEYDYSSEEAGVVTMELAPQYWLWRPLSAAAEARYRLEGLLNLTTSLLSGDPNAKMIDLRPMLVDVERLLPQASSTHRPALLMLHILFNLLVAPDQRTPKFDVFLGRYSVEANTPSVESLIVSTVLDANKDWPIEDHRAILKKYLDERPRPKGFHAPRVLEAAACLTVVEKYRLLGDDVNARLLLGQAVEIDPANSLLREFEAAYDDRITIIWREILFPKKDDAERPVAS